MFAADFLNTSVLRPATTAVSDATAMPSLASDADEALGAKRESERQCTASKESDTHTYL